jgi:hypothetical protein
MKATEGKRSVNASSDGCNVHTTTQVLEPKGFLYLCVRTVSAIKIRVLSSPLSDICRSQQATLIPLSCICKSQEATLGNLKTSKKNAAYSS